MSKEFVTVRLPQSEMAKFTRWTEGLSVENKQKCRILVKSTLYHISRLAHLALDHGFIHQTGFLRSSVQPSISTSGLSGSVYADNAQKNYAAFVEFGTGTGVSVPSFVKDLFNVDAMQWKGHTGRVRNKEAHPFLFDNARIGWSEMIAKLELMGFKKT